MDRSTKKTLLIVDDVDINRDILADIFYDSYNIIEADNGETAIAKLEESGKELALVFLDLQMPKKNGLDVLEFMNSNGMIHNIPVIMITGESTVDSDIKTYELGATDIIYKPFEPTIVLKRAQNVIELYQYRNYLESQLDERTAQLRESQRKLENSNDFLLNALSSVVEYRNQESGEHVMRVKTFTGIILNKLRELYPEYGITKDQLKLIVKASALHDIGKVAISDSILLKPGRLTDEEFETMKTHTTMGCEILENFKQEDNEFYRYCYDICRYHHERYDGRGYPDKISGEDIPIWAQVVSIVDVYDALVSNRVYKKAFSLEEAERMILNGECGTFSPKILKCFEEVKDELFKITTREASARK